VRPSAFLKTNTNKPGYQQKHETCAFISSLFSSPFGQPQQDQPELTAADIEEIIKWLADLWLTSDELRKMMNADDWLKFIEEVIEPAKQEIQY